MGWCVHIGQAFPAELEKIDYQLLAWWRSDIPEKVGDEESDSDAFWTLILAT